MIIPIERFNKMINEHCCVVASIVNNTAVIHYKEYDKVRANEISNNREADLWVKGKLVKTFEKKDMADLCDGFFKEVEMELA